MNRNSQKFCVAIVMVLAGTCFAEDRANDKSNNMSMNQKMKQNENVLCSVTETISEVDEKGNKTGEHETLELFSGKPLRTVDGTSISYVIEKKTDQIYFRYAMTPIAGSIAITDSISGANATMSLNLDDLSYKPSLVGQLIINSNDKLKLLQSDDEVQIWTECGIERK